MEKNSHKLKYLPDRIAASLGISNRRIFLTSKKLVLDSDMFEEIEKILKIDAVAALHKRPRKDNAFFYYVWDTPVKDTYAFEHALLEYQNNHPKTPIGSEPISIKKKIVKYTLMPTIGVITFGNEIFQCHILDQPFFFFLHLC